MQNTPNNPVSAPRSAKIEARDAFAREQAQAAPLLYVMRAASLASGMSDDTLRRLAKRGRIRLVKIEGRTLVDGESLRALIRGDQAAA